MHGNLQYVLSRNLLNSWFRKAKMTASGALRASPASSTTQRQQAFEFAFMGLIGLTITIVSVLCWDFNVCFIVFCNFAVVTHFAPIRFYKQTTLRTEAFAQSSLYAQILLHREVCAQIDFYMQMPLHTEAFTQSFFCTYKFLLHRLLCRKMHLHAQIKAHRRFYTQNLLHRIQRNLCAEQLLHKETFTQEKL